MAGRLVWLKTRLLWNGLRADPQRRVGLPIAVGALAAGAWYLASRYQRAMGSLPGEAAGSLALWAALGFFLVWVTLPVVIFPLDETLDPARFAMAPMGRHRLVVGLAAAGVVAPSLVALAIVLGVNVAVFASGTALVGALLTAAVLGAQLVVGGQLFTTVVSAVIKGRWGRNLAMLIVGGLALGGFAAQAFVRRTVGELGLQKAVLTYRLDGFASLLPPVAAQRVAVDAGAGRWGMALLFLAVAVGWVLLGAAVWARLLDWMLTTPAVSPRVIRGRSSGLAGRRPWGPRSVIARKELRFYLRDPRQRLVWTGAVIFLALAGASILVGTTGLSVFRSQDWLPLVAPGLVLFVGLPIALNQFGWERNAASYLFVLPVKPHQLIAGKNLAATTALLLETAILSLLIAAVTGGWRVLHLVPALGVCAVACQLAVGNVVSVLTPLRLPREGTDVFSQATEQGCLAIASQVASFFVIGVLLIPPASVMVLAVAFTTRISPLVAAGFAVAWGAFFYLISFAISGAILRRRAPEVVNWVQVV